VSVENWEIALAFVPILRYSVHFLASGDGGGYDLPANHLKSTVIFAICGKSPTDKRAGLLPGPSVRSAGGKKYCL
jgi:hypothetical protein